MAFIFPEDKADFTAPNGIAYTHDGIKWRVRSYQGPDGNTVYISEDPPDGAENGDQWFCSAEDSLQMFIRYQGQWIPSSPPATLEGVVAAALLEQDQMQEDVDQLEIKVAELEVTKGSVAKYKVKQTSVGFASRNGELITDSEYITGIKLISLAPYDINGAATKPVSVGDVVEFDMGNGNVARFTVTEGDSANAMTVVNNNGSGLIAVDQFIDVYIYPQNKTGASVDYVDEQVDLRLLKSGDRTTGRLVVGKPANSGDGFCIEGTLLDGTEGKLLSVFHNAGTYKDAVNYGGRIDSDKNIQTKESVLDLINKHAGAATGGVPVGTVMMWMSNTPPEGWFLLKGGLFDNEEYAALHSVLQGMHGYETGVLPDMRGCYPAQGGNAHGNNLTPDQPGCFHGHRTAMPNGGAPTSSAEIPDGGDRGFNGAGGTNAYSASLEKVTIDQGWDSVTRPPTFAVNFIIYAGMPATRLEQLQSPAG